MPRLSNNILQVPKLVSLKLYGRLRLMSRLHVLEQNAKEQRPKHPAQRWWRWLEGADGLSGLGDRKVQLSEHGFLSLQQVQKLRFASVKLSPSLRLMSQLHRYPCRSRAKPALPSTTVLTLASSSSRSSSRSVGVWEKGFSSLAGSFWALL